jgi:uncharacterized protein YjbI with pentapeptide repeats
VQGATLNDADLSGASTKWAGFNRYGYFTSMERVNLTGADLTSTYFMDAYMVDANLTNAKLTRTNFKGANLTGATVTGAMWQDTTCPNGTKSSTGCSIPPAAATAADQGAAPMTTPVADRRINA